MNEEELEKELPLKLKRAAEDKNLVIFLGAGCSSDFGCVSWSNLANKLLNKCFKEGKISFIEKADLEKEENSKVIITICKELLSKKEFEAEMKKALNTDKVGEEKNKDNKAYINNIKMHNELKEMGAIIVTTNADKHIDEFFEKEKIEYDKFSENTKLERGNLYKIHGSIEDFDSLVFTTIRYLERYNDDNFIEFLQKIFSKNTVLFVGYGLQELELLDYLITKTKQNEKKHYLINGYFNHQKRTIELREKYYEQLGIEILPFSKDKDGFEGLKRLITEYAKEIQSTTIVGVEQLKKLDEIMENPYD